MAFLAQVTSTELFVMSDSTLCQHPRLLVERLPLGRVSWDSRHSQYDNLSIRAYGLTLTFST